MTKSPSKLPFKIEYITGHAYLVREGIGGYEPVSTEVALLWEILQVLKAKQQPRARAKTIPARRG